MIHPCFLELAEQVGMTPIEAAVAVSAAIRSATSPVAENAAYVAPSIWTPALRVEPRPAGRVRFIAKSRPVTFRAGVP